ncbi:Retrovirus-related Pol polyprotein from transposon 17.6 [Sesbania bispinosa]|nr:Retrovirus-related Pol polyprotein from transposon 17.6 [Sesbania bispinosa]
MPEVPPDHPTGIPGRTVKDSSLLISPTQTRKRKGKDRTLQRTGSTETSATSRLLNRDDTAPSLSRNLWENDKKQRGTTPLFIEKLYPRGPLTKEPPV